MPLDVNNIPDAPDLTEAERSGRAGNLILDCGELLFSSVDRIKELRRQIAALNGQISDVYTEANAAGVTRAEIRWVLSEATMAPEVREKRSEAVARQDQLWATYQAEKARREAAALLAAEAQK